MLCIKNKQLDKTIKKEIYRYLLVCFKNINSHEGLEKFLKKVMMPAEKNMLFRRIAAMKLIKQGMKYRQIRKMYDISNDVISKASEAIRIEEYKKNIDNKKKYSRLNLGRKKLKRFTLKYKGSENILNLL